MQHPIDVLQQLLEKIKQIPDYTRDDETTNDHHESFMHMDVFTVIVIIDYYQQLIHECERRVEYIQGMFKINPNDQ